MKLKYFEREELVTLIDYYKMNKDRLELVEREIEDLEHILGVKGVDPSKERSSGSGNYRMQVFFEIDELLYQRDRLRSKIKIVDDFIKWLECEYADDYCHEIVKCRANKVRWEQIANKVHFSYNNTRYIFNKGVDNYLRLFRFG